jgi:peroxiredoxin
MFHFPNTSKLQAVALMVTCCILLGSACTIGTEEQRKRQSLPDFEFEGWEGNVIRRSDLPEDKPVTIFYFDPDCAHCKQTMASIIAQFDQFGENTLVIVSSADRTRVVSYLIEHEMLKRPGVKVALCEPQEFLDTFGTTQTPTALFYGGDWDLKRAFKGATNEANILDGLKAAREE